MLVKATEKDISAVLAIYDRIFLDGEKLKMCNWARGKYPTEDVARGGLMRGELYLFFEDGTLKGSVILNGVQPDDYDKTFWKYAAQGDEVLVVHTLCIDPLYEGRGAGGRLLADIENFAKSTGKKVIRFDTYYENAPARQMYLTAGYREAGTAYVYVYKEYRLLRTFEKIVT